MSVVKLLLLSDVIRVVKRALPQRHAAFLDAVGVSPALVSLVEVWAGHETDFFNLHSANAQRIPFMVADRFADIPFVKPEARTAYLDEVAREKTKFTQRDAGRIDVIGLTQLSYEARRWRARRPRRTPAMASCRSASSRPRRRRRRACAIWWATSAR